MTIAEISPAMVAPIAQMVVNAYNSGVLTTYSDGAIMLRGITFTARNIGLGVTFSASANGKTRTFNHWNSDSDESMEYNLGCIISDVVEFWSGQFR